MEAPTSMCSPYKTDPYFSNYHLIVQYKEMIPVSASLGLWKSTELYLLLQWSSFFLTLAMH